MVEVKNAGINKGRAALTWTAAADWDLILAMGDDLTDEDTFRVLPPTAWSIKVGVGTSAAAFNISSPEDAISLLTKLAGAR